MFSKQPEPTVLRTGRKECYQARDSFYQCVKECGYIYAPGAPVPDKCRNLRAKFETACLPSWVKHFDLLQKDQARAAKNLYNVIDKQAAEAAGNLAGAAQNRSHPAELPQHQQSASDSSSNSSSSSRSMPRERSGREADPVRDGPRDHDRAREVARDREVDRHRHDRDRRREPESDHSRPDRDRDRDRDRHRDRDRDRDRGVDRNIGRDRDRDRGRVKQPALERDRDRGEHVRDHKAREVETPVRELDRDRGQDREKPRQRDRDKERELDALDRDREREEMERRKRRSRSYSEEADDRENKRSRSMHDPGSKADHKDEDMADADGAAGEDEANGVDFNAAFTPEELQMMQMMGIPFGFDTTQGKHVEDDAANTSGVKAKTTRTARQYMNRRGGFNRPLPAERTGEKVLRD
eukprot:jgi/Chrzof1/13985/Cz08g20060.t1